MITYLYWGLVIGLALGIVVDRLGIPLRSRSSSIKQTYLFVFSLLLVWLAWTRALTP